MTAAFDTPFEQDVFNTSDIEVCSDVLKDNKGSVLKCLKKSTTTPHSLERVQMY